MSERVVSDKYICIHGHFYQPPRENAWLDEIEIQETATPYHDWNERITEECYGANCVSRILNDEQQIIDIVNNYTKISFNMGPTLLSWLEQKYPRVYNAIIEADVASRKLYGGHGSALAQVYNHLIMPLANRRDKETQVRWGLYDFKMRFGRSAEGMWLAETAVDTETLEVLAEQGVRFTILAPSQARRYRKKGSDSWTSGIDTRRAYTCKLPSGRHIALFFYDGQRSQNVAFAGILNDGKKFAQSLTDGFGEHTGTPQLVHIATDGESYGHHHRNGDMALAYCIRYIEEHNLGVLTNYGQFLSLVPPTDEVEIVENSSWSCAHGVERWQSDCGCQTGGEPHWNQQWRAGLRQALDGLRDHLARLFEDVLGAYTKDCWELRNRYIEVLYRRSERRIEEFVHEYIPKKLTTDEITRIIRLLETQKNALYMYTSCGWFFNEVSGIETLQILQYANRAIQLAERECHVDLETPFRNALATALSNLPEHGTAADIYDKQVAPRRLSLTQVGMHYAVGMLFANESHQLNVLNYECTSDAFERFTAGSYILAMGQTSVKSRVTLSIKRFSFVILYLGNHDLIGHTGDELHQADFERLVVELKAAFEMGNIAQLTTLMNKHFQYKSFSFFELFKDEQHKLLKTVIERNIEMAEYSYEKINDRIYSLINMMRQTNLTVPTVFIRNLETLIHLKLETLFKNDTSRIPLIQLDNLVADINKWKIPLQEKHIEYFASAKLTTLILHYPQTDDKVKLIDNLEGVLRLLYEINIHPSISELQNTVFQELRKKSNTAKNLSKSLHRFANFLNMSLPN
jgi:alpha-amylase/alpha-mannosidase (GH57 family)